VLAAGIALALAAPSHFGGLIVHTAPKVKSLRDRLALGRTGMTVSPGCLGMVRNSRLVLDAFDCGINFFFVTADMHWPLYDGLRRGLAELFRARPGSRDEVVVAAVSYVSDPSFLVQPFRELLDAVPGLGRLDITVAGGVGPWRDIERLRIDALKQHRIAGKTPLALVRATGATFHYRPAAADALTSDELEVVFIRYNTAHRGAEREVFPRLTAPRSPLLFNFKSTYGYVPQDRLHELGVAADAWHPTAADHYRFILTQPAFDGILCSPQTVPQLIALEDAFQKGALTPEQTRDLKSLTEVYWRWQKERHPPAGWAAAADAP
jgi:hypothetical protein